jgi:vacuolar-type H+-ATPase subunit E/Vma4
MSMIEELKENFINIIEENNLKHEDIEIKTCLSSPHEKEILIEADFKGNKGQAFTEEGLEIQGKIDDILNIDLNTSKNRALFIASINAVLRYLNLLQGTVHCNVEEAKRCAQKMADSFSRRYGMFLTIGMVGFQPFIAEALIKKIGKENIRICDKNNANKNFYDVLIEDEKNMKNIVAGSFLTLAKGNAIVDGKIDEIIKTFKEDNKSRIVIFYGVTIASTQKLLGLKRICFESH